MTQNAPYAELEQLASQSNADGSQRMKAWIASAILSLLAALLIKWVTSKPEEEQHTTQQRATAAAPPPPPPPPRAATVEVAPVEASSE